MDTRYQRVSEPINPVSLDLKGTPVTWEQVYAGWESDRYQWYWKRLDLKFAPYDPTYLNRRDERAFELAAQGEMRALSALQRIAAHDSDPDKRARAAAAIASLER